MKCPDCKGKGAVIIDESHNEFCDMCDGAGYIALVPTKDDGSDKKV